MQNKIDNNSVKTLKKQFPLLQQNSKLAYLDSASTTQKPQVVLDAIATYYSQQNANVHRGMYDLSIGSTKLWEDAHEMVAKYLHIDSKEEIIFTSGTTDSLNMLAQLLARNVLKSGDIVVISEMEHHSNIVPWQLISKQIGIEIAWIPVKENYQLDYEWYEGFMSKHGDKVAVVSLVHTSNVLGVTNDVKKYFELAHKYSAITILDAAQSIAYKDVYPYGLEADFLAFSGHKIYGPTGIGVLFGRRDLLEKFEPVIGGGDMISSVSKSGATWNELPWKFEAGTPNIAGGIGLASAIEWIGEVNGNVTKNNGVSHRNTAYSLSKYLFEKLLSLPYVEVFSTSDIVKAGTTVLSFAIKGIHAHDVVSFLSENDIAVRGGYHCAEILHREILGKPSVRASFGIYNNMDDVDRLVDSIVNINKLFN